MGIVPHITNTPSLLAGDYTKGGGGGNPLWVVNKIDYGSESLSLRIKSNSEEPRSGMGSDYRSEWGCQRLQTFKSGFDPFQENNSFIWPRRVHSDYVQRSISCISSDEIKDYFDSFKFTPGLGQHSDPPLTGIYCQYRLNIQ